MARPCFPPPCKPSNATAAEVGVGTPHPMGMTEAQMVALFTRVRLWRLSVTISGTATGTSQYFPFPAMSGTYSGTSTSPVMGCGHFYCEGAIPVAGGPPTFAVTIGDYCGPFAETALARANVWRSEATTQVYTSDTPPEGTDTDTDNFTREEMTARVTGGFTLAFTGSGSGSAFGFLTYAQLRADDNVQAKKYAGNLYPRIIVDAVCPAVSSAEYLVNASTLADPSAYQAGSGSLVATFCGHSLTVPIYLYVRSSNGSWTGSGSLSATLTAEKYWPYKDASGTPLYDEDTGEPV